MEVAIAYMPDYTPKQSRLADLLLGFLNNLWESRNGHCDVGRPYADVIVALALGHDAPKRLLACLPQVFLLLLGLGELKRHAAGLLGHALDLRNLLFHAAGGSGELE